MLLLLAEHLDMPLRERNSLLWVAGHAPRFPEHDIDDPSVGLVRDAIDTLLARHDPDPGFAIDRHWTIIAANPALGLMAAGVDPLLLRPPINALRLFLHPAGLAPRIANLTEWRRMMINRLRRQAEATADPKLPDLLEELRDYPEPPWIAGRRVPKPYDGLVVPFRLVTIDGTLSFLTTTTVLGAPLNVALAEAIVESFFPADPETAAIMRRLSVSPANRGLTFAADAARAGLRYPVMAGDDPLPVRLNRPQLASCLV